MSGLILVLIKPLILHCSPPIGYSRKPVIFLPRVPVSEDSHERRSVHEDDLDRHVEEVLSKRARIRRTMRGVWTFVKTRKCLVDTGKSILTKTLLSHGRKYQS